LDDKSAASGKLRRDTMVLVFARGISIESDQIIV